MSAPIFRRARARELLALRSLVLRPGMGAEKCHFPGDEDADTRHYAVEWRKRVVAIASAFVRPSPRPPHALLEPAIQMRSMVTLPALCGQGLGRALLDFALADLDALAPLLIWCNARVPARSFYVRAGFQVLGDSFDLPDIGPHLYMYLDADTLSHMPRKRQLMD